MATVLTPKKKITYAQALRLVRQLAPAEQRRLRDELTLQRCLASVGVYLVRPNSSANAIRRGRRLAKTIQAELAAAVTASLDETIPLT